MYSQHTSTVGLDKKYISLIGSRLERFAKKSETLWNFRCPICGDSKKSKYKARAYFYCTPKSINFRCHNCLEGMSFSNFLKRHDSTLYREYVVELLKDRRGAAGPIVIAAPKHTPPVFTNSNTTHLCTLSKLSELDSNHMAIRYVAGRKIPKQFYSEIYYTANFGDYIRDKFPNYEKESKSQDAFKGVAEPRIIFPLWDREKKTLYGVSGRDVSGRSPIRYIIAKVSEDMPKIYGLERIDFTKTVHVVEGPIDSLFLHNCVALTDLNLKRANTLLAQYNPISMRLIYDNEPRNHNVNSEMRKAINGGYAVSIWPQGIQSKDINDMITKEGYLPAEIQSIIDTNTFSGLAALYRLGQWAKL